jgi:hypothetical protein
MNSPIDDVGRPVRGASRYLVSRDGDVFTCAWSLRYGRAITYRKMRPASGVSGDKALRLTYDDGIIRTRYIHHLVAWAWIGDPPVGAQCIRHLDGDNQNNSSSNLAYGTHSQNNLDKVAHGTSPDGERNPMAKLTSKEVARIREMLCDSVDRKLIMKAFHISPMTVSRIARNQAWRNP